MVIGDEGLDRVLQQAGSTSDQLWALATEYQGQSRSKTKQPEVDASRAERVDLDRSTLIRLFRVLRPQGLIDKLRELLVSDVADKLDDQWKATASLFDRSTSSDAADDQPLDATAQRNAVSIAISNFRMKGWTRDDYIGQLRGIDNAGLLDCVDNSTLESMSHDEFCKLYESLDEFSFQRARAWQGDYTERQKAEDRDNNLTWLMYQAGYSTAMIAEAMCETLESVQRTMMWAMTSAGLPDSTIVTSLGVSIEDIDRVVWTRGNAHVAGNSDGEIGDVGDIDAEEGVDEVDPVDSTYQLGHVFYNLGDLPDALVWYEKAATAGHVEAMAMLGALFAAVCDPPKYSGRSSLG